MSNSSATSAPVAAPTFEEIEATVRSQYATGDAKSRAAIRKTLTATVDELVRSMTPSNIELAVRYMALRDSLTAKREAVTVAPEVTLSHRIATLELAATLLRSGSYAPEGLDVSSVDYEALPEVNVDDITEAAVKLAQSKITRSTLNRDVASHIRSALAEVGSPLKVSQIVKHRSEEYGADDAPSSGAVAQCLQKMAEGKREEDGFQAVTLSDGKLGAESVEDDTESDEDTE